MSLKFYKPCRKPQPVAADIIRVIEIYRDDSQIWGCIGGVAAYTPPNLGTSTAIPIDPIIIEEKLLR